MSSLTQTLTKEFQRELKKAAAVYQLKAGGNLTRSNIYKSVQTTALPDGIEITFDDYYRYVASGMRKGSRSGSPRVPIDVLIKWLSSIGVSGDLNQIAWAVQESIFQNGWKNGTEPRPFIDDAIEKFENRLDDIFIDNFTKLF